MFDGIVPNLCMQHRRKRSSPKKWTCAVCVVPISGGHKEKKNRIKVSDVVKSNSMGFTLCFRISCDNLFSTLFCAISLLRWYFSHYARLDARRDALYAPYTNNSTCMKYAGAGSIESLEICWIDCDASNLFSLFFLSLALQRYVFACRFWAITCQRLCLPQDVGYCTRYQLH